MRWGMLILAAASVTDAAAAQPVVAGQDQTVAAQRAETRFAPPLGVAQRFRLTITKRGQTHSWIEEVRFERDGDAYVAHWRMDPASLPPAMKHPLLAPMIRPFTGAPVAFELDDEGSVVGVRDWSTQQARLLKSIDDSRPLLLAASGADKNEAETILAATRAMFQQLDAQSGADIILKKPGPGVWLGRLWAEPESAGDGNRDGSDRMAGHQPGSPIDDHTDRTGAGGRPDHASLGI